MALIGGLLSVPLAAEAAPSGISVPSAKKVFSQASKYPAGTYIVTLKDAPAATYSGGVTGFAATRPAKGKQLNAHSSTVTKYTSYLKSRQAALTSTIGIKPLYSYTTAYSGFSAKLTSVQAARLAKSSLVAAITPDSRVKVQEADPGTSLDFLGVTGAGGTWSQVGGEENAGKQVVLGDLDTGIAPENPSFEGDALTSTPSDTTPYKADGDVKFTKGDGSVFSSPIDPDSEQWDNATDLSTKIIAAHYFVDGYEATDGDPGNASQGEYLSPRDGAGHGSHTASTAAGDFGVAASVKGRDFGDISGVAPAAKIAVYKVCWTGSDGIADSADDSCFGSDTIAAVDQAVTDGVDVLNYSIGGGSAATTYSPTDAAFLNASAAGVFVAAAAGNDGPDPSTLDNAAPWETTVAASTIPDYEGTVVLGNGTKISGAGISVTADVSGPLVNAGDHVKAGQTLADAKQCVIGSLGDVTGKIVVCDRGNNARLDKSQAVADAGGIGMVLVNVPGQADDVDNDFHAVPSVHIVAANNEAVHAYASTDGATATLVAGNTTGTTTPVPQIAGFSSHGPVLAAGSDVLKPDIAAPGVSILAAVANAEGADPQWDFYSGTSMATPHIAGLALVYLGENPSATPAEIKSAMMTGATDLVDADGGDVTDPFTQGAGEVHPTTYLDAGLYYPAGIDDWKSYIVGAGQYEDYSSLGLALDLTGVQPIDPSDLNQASIAIGDLLGTQTVTRKVTSLEAGTYTASADVAGVNATVSPSTLDFTAAGQTKTFTVTLERTTAPLDDWATGFLTWTSSDHTVRSPIAVHPDSVTVPTVVSGTGTSGSTPIKVTPGATGSLPLTTTGLLKGALLKNSASSSTYSGVANQADGFLAYDFPVTVPEGTSEYRVDLDPTEKVPGTDLDLYFFDSDGHLVTDQGVTVSADESFTVKDLPAGNYDVVVDPYATPSPVPFTVVAYPLGTSTPLVEGSKFTTDPSTLATTAATDLTFSAVWTGLAPNAYYIGTVHYSDFAPTTEVDIATGSTVVPANTKAPSVSGTTQVGSTVTADPGTWTPSNGQLNFSYQWSANGAPIAGATAASYVIPSALLGQTLTVTVTGTNKVDATAASASASAGVVSAAGSAALVNVIKPTVTGTVQPKHTVKATTGSWNIATSDLTFGYQWTANGKAIGGATSSSYTIPTSKAGDKLAVVVTAHLGGAATAATSASTVVKWNAKTTIKLSDPTITTKVKEKVTVIVAAAGSGKETGTVVVHYGSKTKTGVLHASNKGKIVLTLPKLKKGTYKVYAVFKGNSTTSSDDSITKKLSVRKAK